MYNNEANFAVTGETGVCRSDNLRLHQWQQSQSYENFWVSAPSIIW